MRYVTDRLRGRRREPLPWPKWVAAVLIVYTPVTFLVWTYFIARLLPYLVQKSLALPAEAMALAGRLTWPLTAVSWGELAGFAGSAFFLSFAWVMAWGLGRAGFLRSRRALRSWWAKRQASVTVIEPS
jgi:hypothetical protein